jgi:hypothetical protein
MSTLKIRALEFATTHDAIQHTEAEYGTAVLLEGRPCVVSEDDCVRLAAAGVCFAYLCDHQGQIMTVPVNRA